MDRTGVICLTSDALDLELITDLEVATEEMLLREAAVVRPLQAQDRMAAELSKVYDQDAIVRALNSRRGPAPQEDPNTESAVNISTPVDAGKKKRALAGGTSARLVSGSAKKAKAAGVGGLSSPTCPTTLPLSSPSSSALLPPPASAADDATRWRV